MAVPYHTHNFELPAATKQEVVAGIAVDKVVVPASLGSAAVEHVGAFATAEQGIKADQAVRSERQVIAGEGLQGGGNLSEDRMISLSEASLRALENANNAAVKTVTILAGNGLTGGGSLSDATIELSLNTTSIAALAKAQSAVQQTDLGSLAAKSKVAISDISASGTAGENSFLRGDGRWAAMTSNTSNSGDMAKATYDPNNKNADAFNMDNMVAGTTNKLFTANDKIALDNAAAKTNKVLAGSGLAGGGSLSDENIELSLNATSIAALAKAQSAVQPADLGDLASKSKVAISDINASGTAGENSYLRGDGSWAAIEASGSGSGDMQKSIYDPNNIGKNIYNSDNITEGRRNLFLRPAEKQMLTTIISGQKSLVGQIAFFPANNTPAGWLKANGALISRVTYLDLWSFVVDSGALVLESQWLAGCYGCFSNGNGEPSMFRLPDLRGEFFRALDDKRGIDTERVIGSSQGDAMRNITGNFTMLRGIGFVKDTSGAFGSSGQNTSGVETTTAVGGATSLSFDASRVVPTTNENRPRNIALLACIRY